MKHLLVFLSILILACSAKTSGTAESRETTTIILLRHAEKELTGPDPSLSPAGFERAKRLQVVLSEITPDAFYSTNFLRTKQTLEPWASSLNKTIVLYDPYQPDSVALMLKRQRGKTVVVSGHSNTIPNLVNSLIGRNEYTDLPDNEFGRIFIVTVENGKASVELRNY